MNERSKLLRKIQALGFCVIEANLFLDTHPDDRKALMYFKKHRDMYNECVAAFEQQYGPLTANAVDCDRWTWVDCPWPWETEAN